MSNTCDVLIAYHKLIIEDNRLTEDESLNISNLMHSDTSSQELALILLQGKEFTDEEIDRYKKYIDLINKLHIDCKDNIKPLSANPDIIYTDFYGVSSWSSEYLMELEGQISDYTLTYFGHIDGYNLSDTFERGNLYSWFGVVRYFDIAQ